ncbi:T9SS type A sorting domain-containing protein [Taibaiella koreensis]|uniref:T9SS type A sorting domain-containing protein n=1 Tax=Taibaiella koreensis TaxID=1268548 RepID=UPI000E59B10C|nr:T9SS type A sorting domain-containing protein [Taibaiella koreensis]
MKKTLLLGSLAALSFTQVSAQNALDLITGRHKTERRNASITSRLIQAQSAASPSQKPTATKQRVIAQAVNANINDGEVDSTRYNYSGTNGSHYSYNKEDLNYSQYFTSEYAPMFQAPGIPGSMDVLADSITLYDNSGITSQDRAYYRADKKIDSVIHRAPGGAPSGKIVNVYNPQGYLTATYQMMQSGPSWDTFSLKRYSYNSTFTQMATDSSWFGFMSLDLREKNVYHYSAAGKLDSFINWDLQGTDPVRQQGYFITYNGAGKISTIKNYDFAPATGIASLYSIDSFGYTTGVADFTLYQSTRYEEDTLNNGDRQVIFRNAAGLVDSVKAYSVEGASAPWNFDAQLRIDYNSFSNPEALVITAPAVPGFPNGIVGYRFYYETYEDQPISVRPLTANKDFTVYPNPFSNTISIDWKGQQQSNTTVRLVNIIGQEVFQARLSLKPGQNKLDIPAVAKGNYVLLLQDAAGKSWSTKMVKR